MERTDLIDDYNWIAIHTYSGYENKVAENILKVADSRGMRNQIVDTFVPKDIVVSAKVKKEKIIGPDGKPQRDSEGKFMYREIKEPVEKEVVRYPSYVFVKVGFVFKHGQDDTVQKELSDVAWYIIRNTRGVTGFVGPDKKPCPLSQKDVEQFGIEAKVVDIDFKVGDTVEVLYGTFLGRRGVVTDIDVDNERVKVDIAMFAGSVTPVELALDGVKLSEE